MSLSQTREYTPLQEALLDCIVSMRDNLNPIFIKAELFRKRLINLTMWEKIKLATVRCESAENLVIYFIEKHPERIADFIEIVRPSYYFLAEEFDAAFDKYNKSHIFKPRKLSIFTEHRQKALAMRHKLKRLSHTGDIDTFYKEIRYWEEQWFEFDHSIGSDETRLEIADMYFMCLDAIMEHRRVICDRSLYEDREVFSKFKALAEGTSEPHLARMMFHARRGSSRLLAGHPLGESIEDVEKALTMAEFLPACRETGVVLYIHFNMVSNRYEKNPNEEDRKYLLDTAKRANDHFSREDETQGNDFRRMVLLKSQT